MIGPVVYFDYVTPINFLTHMYFLRWSTQEYVIVVK